MPSQPRPLAEIKDKAVAAWQAEQKQEKAKKQAEALVALVKPDLPLAKAAGDKGQTAAGGGAAVTTAAAGPAGAAGGGRQAVRRQAGRRGQRERRDAAPMSRS